MQWWRESGGTLFYTEKSVENKFVINFTLIFIYLPPKNMEQQILTNIDQGEVKFQLVPETPFQTMKGKLSRKLYQQKLN